MSAAAGRVVRLVDRAPRPGQAEPPWTLVLSGGERSARVIPFDLDLGRQLDHRPIVRRAVLRLCCANPLGRAFWPGRFWDELAWNVRTFDPNVVDVRALPDPDRFARQLGPRIAPIRVAARGALDGTGSDWRRYDRDLTVSIVLPVYNGARYLRQSIESCLSQTHRAVELIVVDDCSSDDTPAIVAELAARDGRIVSLRNATNQRLPGALNVGFARASGALLTWTSHDNYYAENALEVMVRYLCTWPDVDFVYSAFRIVDDEDRPDPGIVLGRAPWAARWQNPVGACFLYRRAVYETVGEFRRDLEYVEDYEYWVRVYKRFRMMRLNEPLYFYRRHAESMTERALEKYGELRARIRAEHFGLP